MRPFVATGLLAIAWVVGCVPSSPPPPVPGPGPGPQGLPPITPAMLGSMPVEPLEINAACLGAQLELPPPPPRPMLPMGPVGGCAGSAPPSAREESKATPTAAPPAAAAPHAPTPPGAPPTPTTPAEPSASQEGSVLPGSAFPKGMSPGDVNGLGQRGNGIGGGGATTGFGAAKSDGLGAGPGKGAKAEARPTPDVVQGTAEAPAAPARAAIVEEAKEEEARARDANDKVADVPRQQAPVAKPPAPKPKAAPPPRPPEPRYDWGGVVHLSNDDSSSLASAQRLLYALDQNKGFTVGQIRPHELLNYFTFQTQAPQGNDTFGLNASAVTVDDNTLKLALAVKGAVPQRQALDLTVTLDRSGSMSAEGRMEYTRRALHKMSEQLRPGDRFDLVLFDNEACPAVKNFVVGRDDPQSLQRVINAIAPRGGTNLDAGLKTAYAVATSHPHDPQRSGRVVLMTDAELNVGDIRPDMVSEIGRHLDARDIHLTGVGVGASFRDDVLDKLTEKGKGAYVFLGSERVVDRLFGVGFDALMQTIALDVRFALDLPDSLGIKRFYGEEMSRDAADIQPVNFQAGNTQLFLQDLAIRDARLVPNDPIRLSISWTEPRSGRRVDQTFATTVGEAMSGDTHNARKGAALMAWSDVLIARAQRADACGAPMQSYTRWAAGLMGDAEIVYTTNLLTPWCGGVRVEPVAYTPPAGGDTRLRLDSDVAISEVEVRCGNHTSNFSLTTADRVVSLKAPAGRCQLTLHGAVPMSADVQIPQTGGELRCVVRGGKAVCG